MGFFYLFDKKYVLWQDISILIQDMPSQFIDEQTRQQYIAGITDILAQIFKITDSVQKQEIYSELEKLDDVSLIAKQKNVEEYLAESIRSNTTYRNQLSNMEHVWIENNEKEQIDIVLNSNLLTI